MGRTADSARLRAAWHSCCGCAVATAPGHQTESNKGVSVTMHVTPDDEPVAGQESRIIVSKVKPSRGSFSWRDCACYLRISDSTGNVVLNRKASAP